MQRKHLSATKMSRKNKELLLITALIETFMRKSKLTIHLLQLQAIGKVMSHIIRQDIVSNEDKNKFHGHISNIDRMKE